MNINELLEKNKIDLTKDILLLPEIKDSWEAFAINFYIKQKESLEGLFQNVSECIEKKGPAETDRIYGKCFDYPFGLIERPVFSEPEIDKLMAIEEAVKLIPQVPGVMLSSIEFTEEKHGLFTPKTYVCSIVYEKRRFEGFQKAAAMLARAFRYCRRPDVEKEIHYLKLCDESEINVLVQLSDCSSIPEAKNEEYKNKAIEQLKRRVSAGDVSVMGIYSKLIMSNSPKAALRFARMAADEGDAFGFYVLGKLYDKGTAQVRDASMALECYEIACGKGNADAFFELGKWHKKSNPSLKAKERAVNFFRAAADQGHGRALYELGLAEEKGEGTKRNSNDAFYCFKAAADLRVTDGIYKLGMAYLNGVGTVKKINEAFKRLKQAADLGNEKAQIQVAKMYAEGVEGDPDWKKAFDYYLKAANSGDSEAQYWVGVYYDDGRGVPKDKTMATNYYMESSDQGNERALRKMSEIFMSHSGDEETRKEALGCLKQVAEAGNPVALSQLGRAYWIGNGTEINHEIAFKYFKQAADRGYREAQYRVGMCFRNGDGTRKNLTQALTYLKMAAEHGHGQSVVEAGNAAKLLKLLKDEKTLGSELLLLKESEEYEQIFRLLFENGINVSDDALIREIFYGFIENAIEDSEGGVYTEHNLLKFLMTMTDKGKELESLKLGEIFYDIGLRFEEEERFLHALTAFVLSASGGCRKAALTLTNMSNEGSRYFISQDKSFL